MTVDGYGVEPSEVAVVVAELVGERDTGEQDETWFIHLSSRMALLQAAADHVARLRGDLVAEMVAGSTEREVATRLNLSPSRPGQLARQSRRRGST
ncbi:hypothetical protein F0L68_40355 [Solihabitans fulvus]|uniref:Uncharacterized protein n=1 Tax=Solihabitans fulvus TaxID=1892852 RepID=A0A5B2W9M5_9PSEU|nr:hypothetical protein [Solihabitans fulvus]KAA2247172.1 hypothetical protein F0L68_40355 [Solihabitans fulvus]